MSDPKIIPTNIRPMVVPPSFGSIDFATSLVFLLEVRKFKFHAESAQFEHVKLSYCFDRGIAMERTQAFFGELRNV